MTSFQIIADSASTFALRNTFTGQFDHGGFASAAWARSFFNLHFAWRPDYRLIN